MRDTWKQKLGYFHLRFLETDEIVWRQIQNFWRQKNNLLETNTKLLETDRKDLETNIKLRSHRLSGGPNMPGDLGRQGGGEG